MNIDKAIEHFSWKFKNVWKPTPKDIEAFNAILDYKDLQETINMSENENLAKLWIHQLMLLNSTEMYSAERSIQVIDEILSKSVYDWCLTMKEQCNMMNWNVIFGNYPEYKDAIKNSNSTQMKKIGSKIIKEKETELKKALTEEIKEDNIIKFVKSQINRIINKFEK